MQGQDWNDVVIRKKAPNSAAAKSSATINAALRSGAQVETAKKFGAGSNTGAQTSTGMNTKKLDDDNENLTHKTLAPEVKKAIQAARLAKNMTQAQLAVAINEKPQTIQEYESGKVIPNQQILGKLERALGVKLRGKNIGQAPPAPGAKK